MVMTRMPISTHRVPEPSHIECFSGGKIGAPAVR
jgi:hypothetical protein